LNIFKWWLFGTKMLCVTEPVIYYGGVIVPFFLVKYLKSMAFLISEMLARDLLVPFAEALRAMGRKWWMIC
jgi:uncharacterized membrane protein